MLKVDEGLRSTVFLATIAIAVMAFRILHVHFHPIPGVLVFGVGIVACAFLMGTAAELIQLDVSQSIAVILVALLAVLPEYAVDIYFAWQAGIDPKYASYALANMTGANRLLIGVGWPLIAFLWWRRSKQKAIDLEPSNAGEIFFLAVATAWSLFMPFKGNLSLLDTGVLLIVFVLYLRFARAQPREEIHLVGPAEIIGTAPPPMRRLITALLFLIAGGGIFAASEPFAESLLACGRMISDDEAFSYYLVQWLAPLASETPEFLVAALMVWKLRPTAGYGALLSSKLNQWTLLVGAVPVAFILSRMVNGGALEPLALDQRQFGELLLTATQSYFGVCILLNRQFNLSEAVLLFVLFTLQMVGAILLETLLPAGDVEQWMLKEKYFFSSLYMVLGTAYLIGYRRHLRGLSKIAFLRPNA